MRELKGKRVLVTGGGQGIGRTLGLHFAAEGAEVLLGDINPQALEEAVAALRAAGAVAHSYVFDVTDPQAVAKAHDEVHRDGGPIDVLVNNAGVVFGGGFLDVPLERHLLTFRVNLLGLVTMTHAFLPDLIERPEGHLVNIASASGLIGLPFGSTYAASKWGVIGFSESIRLELEMQKHRHVGISAICPSYVNTGLFEGARPPLTTSMLTPDDVADLVVHAVRHNEFLVLSPWLVKLTPILKGVLPTGIFDTISWTLGATSSMAHWQGRGEAAEKADKAEKEKV